jgi:1-aminocyclopropane-1-carboxylate deaminase/D-cysteine desulfhydrase-like pyridoxal-dependent ACC family enzyme
LATFGGQDDPLRWSLMEGVPLRLPSPVVELDDERIARHGIRLFLKRDDLINPEIPGNKWRKLKYNIARAQDQRISTLLTFGGAYSNHIRATAAVGHYFGFRTIGVIRGEEHYRLNESLAYATSRGMSLTYMDRSTYRRKDSAQVLDMLREQFGDFYLIPEGGSNSAAVRGCAELPEEIDMDFDIICCACGTGGTLAGISAGLKPGQQVLGFSALKGGGFLTEDVARLQRSSIGRVLANWSINTEFHFGGFARRKPELNFFINTFEQQHGLTLDWIYVAKMMFGIFSLAERGFFPRKSKVIAVITG